jgi:predicted ATP-grasp superfamily ATP-dependent carboligase
MDDALVLLGCVVNGLWNGEESYHLLASQVTAAMPELWGFVGVDFIITPDGPTIVEINPRITTSYVGLKESIGINPAGLVLDLARGGRAWREYRPGGGKAVDVCLEHASVA